MFLLVSLNYELRAFRAFRLLCPHLHHIVNFVNLYALFYGLCQQVREEIA